jgi:hypothetical protein
VLKQEIGRICATLGGWPGARIGQDNVIWKPPGAKPLGYHQDDSYVGWVVPSGYVTVWMALDDTSATGGTLEYVRGSHRWGKFPPIRQFHAPDDYREALQEAAASVGQEVDIAYVEAPSGDGRSSRIASPRIAVSIRPRSALFTAATNGFRTIRWMRAFSRSYGRARAIGRRIWTPGRLCRRELLAARSAITRWRRNWRLSAGVSRNANDS